MQTIHWGALAEELAKLLGAITALLWPIIVAVVAWKLLPNVQAVLQSRNFSIEVAGLKISAQDFSKAVQNQIEDLQQKVTELRATVPTSQPQSPAPIGAVVQASLPPSMRRVLWVDDNPANNAFEIARIKAKSVEIVEARSTAEALRLLPGNPPFGVVISDMGRREDGRFNASAGFDLASQIRATGSNVPIIFFTTRAQVERIAAEANQAGAGVTNSPVELFEMLRRILHIEV